MNTFATTFNITLRIIILFLAVMAGSLVIIAGTQSALAATLKTQSTINADVLTLGDIFDGLGKDKATYVLGPAPKPGKDMTLNARTLMRVAVALDLQWRPSSITDQVTIRRDATVLKGDALNTIISQALKEHADLDGDYDISYSGADPVMILPSDQSPDAEVVSLDYDRTSGRFEARLVAPSKDNPMTHLSVYGRFDEIVSIPVLNKTMKNGDIVTARDIEWADRKKRNIQHSMVLSAEELLGKTPRRIAMHGEPLQEKDLEMPRIVERGESVTIIYADGPILLTAKGRALQDGAKGEAVRVVNTTSSRPIEGLVSDIGTVTVTAQ